jgi:hypothetical protein
MTKRRSGEETRIRQGCAQGVRHGEFAGIQAAPDDE